MTLANAIPKLLDELEACEKELADHRRSHFCRIKTHQELCEHKQSSLYVSWEGSDGAQEIRCRDCGSLRSM